MLRNLIFVVVISFSSIASAVEFDFKFTAFAAAANRDINYVGVIDIDKPESSSFVGEIKEWRNSGANNRCSWRGIRIEGSSTQGGEISWKTTSEPVKGCGIIRFSGKSQGGDIIGSIQAEGRKVEFVMKRK